jgi:putative transcriptional regulator
MKSEKRSKTIANSKTRKDRKPRTVGESVIQGLKEAIAWTKGENDNVRVTVVEVPQIDVRKVRLKMGLSQAQFACKFGFPPARVLLAVIARHPEAVEDVLRNVS